MMLVGASSIREVIAFPKMRDGSCAMMDAPSKVDQVQLEELSLFLTSAMEFEKRKETLDLSVIEYVSELAKIELSPFEKEIYAKDLNDVIAFADAIANIDVSTYEPLNYVGGGESVLREDEVKHSLSPQNVLQNAPSQYENCFFVPKTVE